MNAYTRIYLDSKILGHRMYEFRLTNFDSLRVKMILTEKLQLRDCQNYGKYFKINLIFNSNHDVHSLSLFSYR